LRGSPAGGEVFHRGCEVGASGPFYPALTAGLAGLRECHPEEPFGILSDDLRISRTVFSISTGRKDLVEEVLLGAGQFVLRGWQLLGFLGNLLG
jgi:hypothetical protein